MMITEATTQQSKGSIAAFKANQTRRTMAKVQMELQNCGFEPISDEWHAKVDELAKEHGAHAVNLTLRRLGWAASARSY